MSCPSKCGTVPQRSSALHGQGLRSGGQGWEQRGSGSDVGYLSALHGQGVRSGGHLRVGVEWRTCSGVHAAACLQATGVCPQDLPPHTFSTQPIPHFQPPHRIHAHVSLASQRPHFLVPPPLTHLLPHLSASHLHLHTSLPIHTLITHPPPFLPTATTQHTSSYSSCSHLPASDHTLTQLSIPLDRKRWPSQG